MKILFRAILAIALLVGATSTNQALAQNDARDRAAAIVAVENIDAILKDASHLVTAAGFPQFAPLITFSAGEYVQGLDRKKPAGAILTFDGEEPVFVGFIPVTDLDDFLDVLSNAGMEIDDEDDGVKLITAPGGEEFYMKGSGGWAFIGDSADRFGNLPKDPAKIVSGLAKEYMVSAKVLVKNIPKELREKAIGFMREGFEDAIENSPGANEELADLQKKINKMSMDNFVEMIQDAQALTIGFKVDKDNKQLVFDTKFEAKPSSVLSKRFAKSADVKSRFSGFLREGAAMKLAYSMGLIDKDKSTWKEMLSLGRMQMMKGISDDANLDDDAKTETKEAANKVLDAITKTIESGSIDAAGSLVLTDEKYDFVFGGHIEDAKKIEEAVKQMVKTSKEDLKGKVEVKLNAKSYKGVKFHTFNMKVPDEDAADVFGDEVLLAVGISQDSVYLGIGNDSIDSVKSCIDDSKMGKGNNRPMHLEIKFSPILSFAAENAPNAPEAVGAMAKKLKEAGNDKIIITTEVKKNVQETRIAIQEGILKLIGVGVEEFQRGFGGGFDDF